ncbi:hypothetical protein EV2_009306 [Malus domestica]
MNTTPIALSLIIMKWRDEEGSRIPVVGKFLSHYLVRSGDKKKVQEFLLTDTIVRSHRLGTPPAMPAKYIIPAVLGSFAVAWTADHYFADKKIFGGSTPSTVANKEWWEETDKKFQAWPRTAGPPVVMNPISRQNFIVKSRTDS